MIDEPAQRTGRAGAGHATSFRMVGAMRTVMRMVANLIPDQVLP